MSRPSVRKIAGERIDLVDIAPEYFETIIRWRNDPGNRRYFFSQHAWTLEGQEQWYARYQADPGDMVFVIVLKSGMPVGTISLYAIDEAAGTAEFGRMLIGERSYRRLGLGYEACRLCLSLAFDTLRLQEVYLEVFDWNTEAIRLYERLGFVIAERIVRRATPEADLKIVKMVLRSDHRR